MNVEVKKKMVVGDGVQKKWGRFQSCVVSDVMRMLVCAGFQAERGNNSTHYIERAFQLD